MSFVYDPTQLTDSSKLERPGNSSNFITKLPPQTEPLIVKFLAVPADIYGNGKSMFVPVTNFPHLIGNNPNRDKRFHPSGKLFGDKTSPEEEAYWEAMKKVSALKKMGQHETVECKKLMEVCVTFKPKSGGWIYVVEPNSSTVKALKIGQQFIDKLVGRKATAWSKEVKSVLTEMQKHGLSPFNIMAEAGWVRIFKTGEEGTIATEHHLELHDVQTTFETKDGRKIQALEPFGAKVASSIYDTETKKSSLTLEDFPNPLEYERRNSFTHEESVAFVKSNGTEVPVRFLKRADNAAKDEMEVESGVSGIELPDLGLAVSTLKSADVKTASSSEVKF